VGAVNGRDYTIVGVMPPGFRFPDGCELWLPAGWNGVPRDRRGGHWLSVIARLKPGVALTQARTEMNTIQARLEQQYREAFIGSQVAVIPLLEQTVGRTARRALLVLWGVVAGVLFGLAPAWQFSRPDVNEVLKDTSRSGSTGLREGRMRNALVVSEIALSLILLIGAGLMLRSFARLAWMDRGFNPEHLLTAQIDFKDTGFSGWTQPTNSRPHVPLHELMERLRKRPGVQAVGAIGGLPTRSGGPPGQPILIEGRPPAVLDDLPKTDGSGVTPEFFRALGVSLLRGRDFTEAGQLHAPPVRILNETFARRYFPNENPIGKRLATPDRDNPRQPAGRAPWDPPDWQGPWCDIVGVVSDVKNFSLNPEPVPQTFVPYWQSPIYDPLIVLRTTGDPTSEGSRATYFYFLSGHFE